MISSSLNIRRIVFGYQTNCRSFHGLKFDHIRRHFGILKQSKPSTTKLSASSPNLNRNAYKIKRQNESNFMAKWQQDGEYYVSYENLKKLDDSLLYYDKNRRQYEKRFVYDELSLTYFGRLHNIIREEYQYEKSIVEERLKFWTLNRLKYEGYTLTEMRPIYRGNIYQEKVFRFIEDDPTVPYQSYKDKNNHIIYKKLPFHRFNVGDSIRLSFNLNGSPLDDNAIDGMVLDKRSKYIEVAVRSTDADKINSDRMYRMDSFVNRVTYDRMIDALQLFVSNKHSYISRNIRDLMLYSYPNGMIRLSQSPGGLKLALPKIEYGNLGTMTRSSSSSEGTNNTVMTFDGLDIYRELNASEILDEKSQLDQKIPFVSPRYDSRRTISLKQKISYASQYSESVVSNTVDDTSARTSRVDSFDNKTRQEITGNAEATTSPNDINLTEDMNLDSYTASLNMLNLKRKKVNQFLQKFQESSIEERLEMMKKGSPYQEELQALKEDISNVDMRQLYVKGKGKISWVTDSTRDRVNPNIATVASSMSISNETDATIPLVTTVKNVLSDFYLPKEEFLRSPYRYSGDETNSNDKATGTGMP
jgi:hypothetical protein